MALAPRQGGVIVNADALQVFANWRILTARPGPEDEDAARHALYGHVPGDQPYSVGQWLRDLRPFLAAGQRPIITGGTGLYFSALTEGLAEIPETPAEVRAMADARLAAEGSDGLLAEIDAETVRRIDRQNPARIQRAWEVQHSTGRGLAAWQDDTPAPLLPLHRAEAIVIDAGKEWLSPRIERRFDQMLATGAIEEVRANLAGWNPALPSAKAIGAAEIVSYLKGEITLEEARRRAIISTQQFAKRQRTWFRGRMTDWTRATPPC